MHAGPERLSSALSDRYLIERELGAGGMATVYLAQDLKHDRKVAIKVLRPELAAVIGAERFLSEIKTTANLQHPQILPLHDSGEADGFLFYVMPYVEGESLRDRLMREKQLPIPDAVRIATEVAGALDYAHRHNVIHRDIKPENILLHDGHALVADFGIALAASKAGNTRMTETGMSLGTPHYMSPEQAMGEREITARSDVYALGCVLYEMLTGDPPFTGSTAQAIVARVLTETPRSMAIQRHTIPEAVEVAVLTALEKLPADRYASAAEFATALTSTHVVTRHDGQTVARVAARRPMTPRARLIRWIPSAAALLFAVLAAWGWFRPAPAKPVVRYSMGFPAEQSIRQGLVGVSIAISPDGRRMVYVGAGTGGDQLWLRERDQLSATPIPGTTFANSPYFSPDGNKIAFSAGANSDLKIVTLTGGPPITLTVPGPGAAGGGTWGVDGYIYYDTPGGISRIRAEGGTPELILPYDTAKGEIGFAWPEALPNGKGLVFRTRRNLDPTDFDIGTLDFATKERHILGRGLMARYVAPGYLIFLRNDGALLAAPFDQGKMVLTGATVPLFEGVGTKAFGAADLAVSRSGTLAYVPGTSTTETGIGEVVMVGRDGSIAPFDPPFTYNPGANRGLSLSPDGRRLALDVVGAASPDIWVKQLPAGPFTRLTFDARAAYRPTWTSDGRYVLYISAQDSGLTDVWRRKADGSAPAERFFKLRGRQIPEAILSRDGQWLVYRVSADSGNRDIYAVHIGRDTTPIPLLTSRYWEYGPALSPNGKWLAYTSNESGRDEIYVSPFPRIGDGRWQISTTGGATARWAHSGRELLFESATGDLMTLPVRETPGFQPGTPQRLFRTAIGMTPSTVVPYYDLTPDDKRLVMVRLAAGSQPPGGGQLVVVDNWFTELFARMKGH